MPVASLQDEGWSRGGTYTHMHTHTEPLLKRNPCPSGGNHQGRTGKTDKLGDDRRQPAQGAAAPTGAGSLEEMPRLGAKRWSRTEETLRDLHRAEHRTDGEECVFLLYGNMSQPHTCCCRCCHTYRFPVTLPDRSCPLALLQQHDQEVLKVRHRVRHRGPPLEPFPEHSKKHSDPKLPFQIK